MEPPVSTPLGPGTKIPTGFPTARTVRDEPTNVRFTTHRYTDAHGLPKGTNRGLIVDHTGYVWVANSLGLVRLGGDETIVFGKRDGLPSDSIRFLFCEGARRFWVGTDDGLACIYPQEKIVEVIPAFAGVRVLHIGQLHDKSRLAVATERGLFAWDKSLQTATALIMNPGQQEPRCLCSCPDPSMEFTWVSTDDGLRKFDGERFTPLAFEDKTLSTLVLSIFADSRGGIWFGSEESIFYYGNSRFKTIRSGGKTGGRCGGFFEDSQGLIWLNSAARDGRTTVSAYGAPSPDGLVHEITMPAMHVGGDQFGGIWTCGPVSVSHLDRNWACVVDEPCSVVTTDGRNEVWFATNANGRSYLQHISNGLTLDAAMLPVESRDAIRTLLPHRTRRNHVWVGTHQNGLLLFNGQTFAQSVPPSDEASENTSWPETTIVDLMYDTTGVLWCATDDKIYSLEQDQVVARWSIAGRPLARIEQIAEYQGRIACATTAGVLFLDASTGEFRLGVGAEEGLLSQLVQAVEPAADGSLWIGTDEGLYRYRDGKAESYVKTAGLPHCAVQKIVADGSHLWVSTEMGVAKVNLTVPISRIVLSADYAPINESGGALAMTTKHLWAATTNGLVRYAEAVAIPRVRPFIETETDRSLGRTGRIRTTTDTESIRFRIHAVSHTTREHAFTYRYRLLGHDDQWKTTNSDTVRYVTPNPGSYVFEAQVFDGNLLASPPVRVQYRVTRPLTRWARSAALYLSLCSCVLLGVLYVQRVRHANRDLGQRVRQRTAETLAAQQEKHRLQEELFHSQKMESLGTMAAGMAHDFNNALCAITSNAEIGLLQIRDTKRVQASLSEVIAGAHQAAGLTKSMLTFAGKSATSKRPVRLDMLIPDSVKMIRTTISTSIRVDLCVGNEPVWCDADDGQLQQVIINLVLNASDAMPNGGTLTVEVGSRQTEGVREAVIRVQDDGHGMDVATVARAFEPFYTTKSRGKGTGLGLSIAHSIITAHGGTIAIESTPHRGTSFDIHLPICEPPVELTNAPPPAATPIQRKTGTVIVADDETQVRTALMQALEQTGLHIIGVKNGEELVRVGERKRQDLALVVADIDMPKLDGLSAVKQLRKHNARLPVIIVTGRPTLIPDEAQEGPTSFLRKPFQLHELLDHANRLPPHRHDPSSS